MTYFRVERKLANGQWRSVRGLVYGTRTMATLAIARLQKDELRPKREQLGVTRRGGE